MLDKLVEEQEITNEQILLLRQEMRTFTRELQRERLQMTEFLRERANAEPKEEPSAETSETTEKRRETEGGLEGGLSLKNILLTVAGIGASLYAFRDKLPAELATKLATTIASTLKNIMFNGTDPTTDPDTVPLESSPTAELAGVTAIKAKGAKLVTGGTNYVLRSAGNTVTETLQEIGTRPTASKTATAAAELVTETIPNNRISKAIAAKVAGAGSKLTGAAVPLIGSGVALYFSAERIAKGDYAGAALEAGAAIPGVAPAVLATAASVTRDVYSEVYGITPEKDFLTDPEGTMERHRNLVDQVLPAIKNYMESQEFARKKGIKSKIDLLESQPIGLLTPEQRSELQVLKGELSMYPATQIPMPLSQQGAEELYGSAFVDTVRGGDFVDQLITPNPSARLDVSNLVDAGTSEAIASDAGAKTVTVLNSSQTSQTAVTGVGGDRAKETPMSPEARSASTIDAYAYGK